MSGDKYAQVILGENGEVAIDIEMPEGADCDGADAALRFALVALGVAPKEILDEIKKTAVPDGIPTKVKH
jgi:hypothetical protein